MAPKGFPADDVILGVLFKRKRSRNGLVGSDRVSECGQKSRMLSPNHRFLIAMHSLDGVVETRLPVRRPENVSVRALSSVLSDTFSRPVRERKRAKLRRFRAISRVMRQDFSALQTVWRSERDSNSQYLFFERASAGTCASCTPFSINNIHPEKRRTAEACEGGAVS